MGLYRDNGKMETVIVSWGIIYCYIVIMEKKMETIIV